MSTVPPPTRGALDLDAPTAEAIREVIEFIAPMIAERMMRKVGFTIKLNVSPDGRRCSAEFTEKYKK